MIYLSLFFEFFKVGLFCFGGAFGMIPVIEETVLSKGWLTHSEFYSFIGVCESTPGPIAVNTATYVGSMQAGFLGSICASLGVVMPSFIVILLLAAVLKNFAKNRFFKGFIKGVQPIVTALILSTGIMLLADNLGYKGLLEFELDIISLIIFAAICAAYFLVKKLLKHKMSAVQLVLLSAGLGIIVSVIAERVV